MDWTETEAENTQQGRGKAPGDNVVRLPRDWLGPREELVPFGPPAEAEVEAEADGAEPADSGVPPTAHDFWEGGDFSSAHDGFQEPVRRNRRRVWPGLPRGFAAASRARQGLIAGTMVVTLLVAGMLVAAGTRESPPSKPSRLSAQTPAGALAATPTGIKAARLGRSVLKALDWTERVRERTAPRPVHRTAGRRRATDRRARHRDSPRHTLRKAISTAQSVGYTTSTPAAAGASDTTASSGPSTASASATAASSSTGSDAAIAGGGSSGGSAGSGSGFSSSTSQPATGANGTLGPGSSPDG